MKYPLSGLSVVFCSGILLGVYLRVPLPFLLLFILLFLISAVIFIKQGLKSQIFILCAVFLLGAALLRNSQVLPVDHIARLIPYKSGPVPLIGVIDNDPVYKGGVISFILKAEKLGMNAAWQKTCGKVLVKVRGNNEFSYGERLFLKGKLYRPPTFPKSRFNYRDYLRHRGIFLVLSVKKYGPVKRLDKNAGNPLKFFGFRIKHKLKDVIAKNLSFFSAGILSAIILGERQNLTAPARAILMQSGTVHIIAISGLHIGIVAFIALVILKIIRVPRKPRYVFTVLFLIIYCILTGANLPVIRASVMAGILLLAYFFKREINIYNSLSVAALIILSVNPWQFFEISFQLSFLSVIAIVWLTPRIQSLFPEKLNKMPRVRILISVFCASCSAWLGLLPLIAFYFRIFSPVAILANMIIVPYMTIVVASGFALVFAGILISPLAPVFAASCELFISLLFKIDSLLISIPGAYFRLPRMPLICILLYYLLLVSLFSVKRRNATLHI